MIRTIGKVIGWIVIAGLALALLRAFNFDVIGVIQWAFNWIWGAIMTVADFLTGNPTFQRAVDSPS